MWSLFKKCRHTLWPLTDAHYHNHFQAQHAFKKKNHPLLSFEKKYSVVVNIRTVYIFVQQKLQI